MPILSLEGAVVAAFDRADDASRAMDQLRARGYTRIESYSPFPLTSEDGRRRDRWPALAIIVFAAGATGALLGYLVQWYANAYSYPLNIGGRPTHAVAAFIYPSVEALILCAGLATFVGVLVAMRLPRLWRPELEIEQLERSSTDRFWIAVGLGSGGGDLDRTSRELRTLRATRVIHVVAES